MSAPFTPGPWKYGHLGDTAFWIGPDYDRTPVATVEHDTEAARDNSRENARLIAAAPDLLTAAMEAVATIKCFDGIIGAVEERENPWNDTLRTLRAAIARATGAA